ncbi:MAG: hypothetical protein N2712_00455 [Brevinematales bacterium]|nr:hypothetical protein [Brevinematales bacterium]
MNVLKKMYVMLVNTCNSNGYLSASVVKTPENKKFLPPPYMISTSTVNLDLSSFLKTNFEYYEQSLI